MASIFSLYGSVFIDNEKANKSLQDTTNKGKEASKSWTESLGSVVGNVAKVGTAVVAGASTVVGGLSAIAMSAANTAGNLDDTAQRTGVSAEEFQKYAYAAKLSGMESENIEKAMIKQQKAFADAQTGSKSMSAAYQSLGIDIKNIGSSGDAFDAVIMKLSEMDDETQRNALANDIFGKSYADLAPLLNSGADGISAMKQEAVDLGAVMSNEAVSAGASFGDTIDKLKMSFGAIAAQLGTSLMPVVQPIIDMLIANLPTIQGIIGQLAPVFIDLLTKIVPPLMELAQQLFPIILDLITQLLPPIMDIVGTILPILTQLLAILLPPLIQIISAILPPLISIIKALMPILKPVLDLIAWAIDTVLMPIIGVVTSIINVIAKGLVGAINVMTPVVKGVLNVFKDVFGGLFNIVKVPINLIIDGINLFIKALNKIKIPDWVPGVGGKGINLPLIQKLRVGIDYVPYDEMPAILHKGEAVLSKEEADEYFKLQGQKAQPNQPVTNYNNTINVEKLEVRDETDIKRIAEELYYLQQRRAY